VDVEGAFRSANDRIAEQARVLGFAGPIPFLCECDDPTCVAIVRRVAAEYAASRASGTPIVLPVHPVHAEPSGGLGGRDSGS
jgi:hypothetical protein